MENLTIFQTNFTTEHTPLTLVQKRCVESVQTMHPNSKYFLYNLNDAASFISEKMPEVYTMWSCLPTLIAKADVFRFIKLYVDGGIYFDLDVECFKPVYELLGTELTFSLEHPKHAAQQGVKKLVATFFISADKGNKFLLSCINDMLVLATKQFFVYEGEHVINSTGPMYITKALLLYSGDVTLINHKFMCPLTFEETRRYAVGVNTQIDINYALHYYASSWSVEMEQKLAVYEMMQLISKYKNII